MAQHPDTEYAARRAGKMAAMRDAVVRNALANTADLVLLAGHCVDLAAFEQASGRTAALPQTLALALEASMALLDASRHTGQPITYRLAGQTATNVSTLGARSGHPGVWFDAFAAAILLGDRLALARLGALPPVEATAGVEPYLVQWQRAVRSFAGSGRFDAEAMLEAMEATEPERLPPDIVDFVLAIDVPAITVAWRVAEGDGPGVDAALAEGLTAHEHFWSRGAESLKPEGFVSWRLSAWKRVARDRGLAPNTRSRYLVEP